MFDIIGLFKIMKQIGFNIEVFDTEHGKRLLLK